MKITALVENKSEGRTIPKHGLSLYIETQKHKILFDLGPDDTPFKNAEIMNIDLSEVDTVIISHGHMDHGGALKRFLQVNGKARIYAVSYTHLSAAVRTGKIRRDILGKETHSGTIP